MTNSPSARSARQVSLSLITRTPAVAVILASIVCAVPGQTMIAQPGLAQTGNAQTEPPQTAGTQPDTKSDKKAEATPAPKPQAGAKAAPKSKQAPTPQKREGAMTLARMDEIIRRLDDKVKSPRPGIWQFQIENRAVIIVSDAANNRMRILSPVGRSKGVPESLLKRLMQANFDTALDARYAIAKGLIWATFIHPLSTLHDRQFISAIGQTVNLAVTFGTTFSSGAMSFGGGDSRAIIRKQLIEKLIKKGLPI